MVETLKCCILTEGGKLSGLGHITRYTSFYDALYERGHYVEFLIHGDRSINALLAKRKFKLLDWHRDIRFLKTYLLNFEIVILDSFQVVQDDIDLLCDQNFVFVSIDDYLRNKYHDTIVIDWTIDVEKSDVHIKNNNNSNILLLGLDNIVLRKPFWNSPERSFSKLKNVLVSLGGSDIRRLTLPLVIHLSNLFSDIQFHVIIGTYSELHDITKKQNNSNIKIYESIDSYEMKMLMDRCDIAISGGGQTLYELASVGIPTIAIKIIENQKEDIDGWKLKGLIYKVIDWNDIEIMKKISEAVNNLRSEDIRKSIYNNVKNLVKGDNVFRIIELMESKTHVKNRK
jgi:UDP-2,4-diacetamido-2,4,6-trideoxy-beta-L-altropyranose hydrolase